MYLLSFEHICPNYFDDIQIPLLRHLCKRQRGWIGGHWLPDPVLISIAMKRLNMILLVGLLGLAPGLRAEGPKLVMSTQGYMLFAPHIHGRAKTSSSNAGYRMELLGLSDIVRWNRIYASFLTANKTLIARSESAGFFKLDQLKYTLSPDLRIEFDSWLMRASYVHESLHTVSRSSEGSSVWMNSYQVSVGSKGSNYLFLWEEFENNRNRFLNHIDALLLVAVYRSGRESIWVAKNHDYTHKIGSRLRFQVGSFNRWAFFIGSDLTAWHRETNDWEGTGIIRFNAFRKGAKNLGGFYYSYNFYDSYRPDNEEYLGSLGFQVIF
jgi:hypothetical protein